MNTSSEPLQQFRGWHPPKPFCHEKKTRRRPEVKYNTPYEKWVRQIKLLIPLLVRDWASYRRCKQKKRRFAFAYGDGAYYFDGEISRMTIDESGLNFITIYKDRGLHYKSWAEIWRGTIKGDAFDRLTPIACLRHCNIKNQKAIIDIAINNLITYLNV